MQSETDQKKRGIMDSATQQDFIVEEINPASAHLHQEENEEKCWLDN